MHLLWVANFAPDTGYAWETIESVFRRVGERLVRDGHRVTVCYASRANAPSRVMQGAPFAFAAYDYGRGGARGFVRLLRERGVDALYLTDRATWSGRYPLYRLAGVRRIIVHDRTSGARTVRAPAVHLAKRALHGLPWLSADCFVAVSDFVRDRLITVNGTPPARTHRIYNGIDLSRFDGADRSALPRLLGVDAGRRIVFCSGRVQPYKGMQTLVDAFALLRDEGLDDVELAVAGDGPYLEELRGIAARHDLRNVHFLGRRTDIPALLAGATVAVVPSLWEEAFGLAVVEAMAAGVPLVASRTGGIPELVEEGGTGMLVPPGDARALADALRLLLRNPALRGAMAVRGPVTAHRRFSLDRAAADLCSLVSRQLLASLPTPVPAAVRPARP
ncbi:MAG TPA: glycosyltransferase family 4 protein [Longimicrobium sp.]|nr:glycosyltransferase family 4 protein [Longimicrobium sp.]